MTITKNDVTYWPTYETARDYAIAHGYPTDRIIKYGLGWAVQLRISGPYVNATETALALAEKTFQRARAAHDRATECASANPTRANWAKAERTLRALDAAEAALDVAENAAEATQA